MKNKIITVSKILKSKLQELDLEEYDFNTGYKNYLKNYILMYDIIIQRYVAILKSNFVTDDAENKSFMDYGGGTGILSLLAKLSGIGYVCYVDVDYTYTQNFKKLQKILGVKIDLTLNTSYESIDMEKQFDLIANYDVLEHINKPLLCFINLKKCLKENGRIYMGSGANKYNFVSYYLNIIKHKKVEPLNSLSDNYEKRYKYIKENYDMFSDDAIKKITFATRGLMYSSIDAYIELYLIVGEKPNLWIKTNTAPPDNGVWSEHCFNFFNLGKELNLYFSNSKVELGYYPIAKPKFEKPVFSKSRIFSLIYPLLRFFSVLLAPFLNLIIKLIPVRVAVFIAPYYIINAKK